MLVGVGLGRFRVSGFWNVFFFLWVDNEEIEGSDVFADYLLGDVEGEEDEFYLLDSEYVYREWGRGWEAGFVGGV